jgi:DNA-binding response OmpR family regulator
MSRASAHSISPFVDASKQSAGYDLADVQVVLFSPVQNTRRVIMDAIHGAGFRRVNVVHTIENLRKAVRAGGFDMLVLETKAHFDAICEHIADIRHGRIGDNPFVVINVITWKPSDDVIRTLIDTGADDIMVMPISIGAVTSRVDNIIENRKKFIATMRYVGPDRRGPNRASDADLKGFDVPNGLRYKATGDESAKVDLGKIQRASSIVLEHRLRRTALRFGQMAGKMEQFIKDNPGQDIPAKDYSEMSDAALYISRHIEDDARSEILQLVESLQKIMAETEVKGAPDADLFALLKVHGEALLALQRGEEKANDMIVRAIFTATKVIDRRVKERRQAVDQS